MSNLELLVKDIEGVGFYTDAKTGRSGVTQSGLAILCGVTRDAISKLLNSLYSKKPYKGLEHLVDKISECRKETETGMWLCNDELCIAVIRYYDRKGNKTAQFTFDKFASIGFNTWVQGITGWQAAQPQPESSPQPEVIMPTAEELEYMKSRKWEKDEVAGKRVLPGEAMKRSGYRRALEQCRAMRRAW